MDQYSYIANAHGAYIDELYKSYQQDPEAVDFGWRKFFEGFEFSQTYPSENGDGQAVAAKPSAAAGAPGTDEPPPRLDQHREEILAWLKTDGAI